MPKAEILIQYSSSTAFASGIIRRMCHSPWSHVDIVLPGEGLLGASGPDAATIGGLAFRKRMGWSHDPGGVMIRPFDPWPYRHKPLVASLMIDSAAALAIINNARSQIGKPFDGGALYSFLSDKPGLRDWRDTKQWFCSELVTWALELSGVFPYPLAIAKNRVSPADTLLMVNPFMSADNINEFIDELSIAGIGVDTSKSTSSRLP